MPKRVQQFVTCLAIVVLMISSRCIQVTAAQDSSGTTAAAKLRTPPDQLDEQALKAYVEWAEAFITANPDSTDCAIVMFDLATVRRAMGHDPIATALLVELMLNHPQSLRSWAALGLLSAAPTLRDLMLARWERQTNSIDREFIAKWNDLFQRGKKRFPDLMIGANDAFAVRLLIAAEAVGSESEIADCHAILAQSTGVGNQIYRIVSNPALSVMDKVLALFDIEGVLAADYCKYLKSQLSEEERQSASIRLRSAVSAIDRRQYAEAVELLSTTSQNDPQWIYVRAYANMLNNNFPKAIEDLKSVVTGWPDADWSNDAKQLLPVTENPSDTYRGHMEAIAWAIHGLQQKNDRFEFMVEYQRAGRSTKDFFFGLDAKQQQLHVSARTGEKVICGYNYTAGSCMCIFPDDERIHIYKNAPMAASLRAAINEQTAEFNFHFDFNNHTTLTNPLKSLLQIRSFTSMPGVVDMVRKSELGHYLPLDNTQTAEGVTFRWIRPKLSEPGFSHFDLVVDAERHLVAVRCDEYHVKLIYCGDSLGNQVWHCPQWPDAETIEHEAMETSDLFRLAGGGMALLDSSRTADHPTAEKKLR